MGVALAFAVAVLESLKDALGKVGTRYVDAATLLFLYKVVALVLVLPFAIYTAENVRWAPLLSVWFLNSLLNATAFYLYLRAISLSPLSLTVPMLSFSPAFLLITSRIMLGQSIPPLGALGVILVAVGAYVLNVEDVRRGLLRPLIALFLEAGPRYMLAVSLVWSITANLDRIGVGMGTPFLWVALMDGGVALAVLPLALRKGVGGVGWRFPLAMGVADGVGATLQMFAITLAPVPYVIAIKRTSILLSSVLGILLFKEERWRERLLGASVMLAGAITVVISLFGP